MPRWFHRVLRSPRAGPLLALATGMLVLGSCGGALLANYTVAGMDPSYRGSAGPIGSVADAPPRGWADQAASNFTDDLMDESRIAASEASYRPDGAGVEYAIGD